MNFKKTRLLHWEGDLPQIGDCLKTSSGSFYTVLSFKPNTRPNPKSVGSMGLLKLSREDVDNLPEDTLIHNFKWTSKREKEV
jgi:hypothetical protein